MIVLDVTPTWAISQPPTQSERTLVLLSSAVAHAVMIVLDVTPTWAISQPPTQSERTLVLLSSLLLLRTR
jgi:hypothetical protein